jgi:hypothetical protein
MAAETIYSNTDFTGTSWCIERQPEGVTDPLVVSFRKWNRRRSMLNQNAKWSPDGWDRSRWVPSPPAVPQLIVDLVNQRMKESQE